MPKNLKIIINSIINLPTPSTINYNWNIGSLLGLALSIQLISGFLLSIHYSSSIVEAFSRVIHISRDINNGWLIRIIHMNGASLFFILIYYHIGKNLLNRSFKLDHTWNSGVSILLILIGTAFLGYILPWGQISFWAATVITNLVSAIPIWGKIIVEWLWGGFSVSGPTLTRFFSLHFILPFVIAALAIVHIITLHSTGSSNPLGIPINADKLPFHNYFTTKDLVRVILTFTLFIMFILVYPYMSADPENFTPANPLSTPAHIQPEWYFLFAYAILRSIPNKLGGVVALVIRIVILLTKPLQITEKNSFKFNPKKKLITSRFFLIFIILTILGAKQIEYPYRELSVVCRVLYFILCILI